ncbi:MAG: sarcosine oxidase [Pseudomonadaceae bacterium]|nr:MAG: sarcosine oxidase [Pseudomonadaceae bacterium]
MSAIEIHASSPLQDHPGASASPRNQTDAGCLLSDWSLLPRVGFRGTDTPTTLTGQGYQLPEQPNQASRQTDGSLLLRLSAKECMLLASSQASAARIEQLEQRWQQNSARHYLLPRMDSHAWFHLQGPALPQLLAKLCAIDLRTVRFTPGQLVQTSVARNNAIVVNSGGAQQSQFELLCDRATARYMWDVLLDAMAEFNGQVIAADTDLANQGDID